MTKKYFLSAILFFVFTSCHKTNSSKELHRAPSFQAIGFYRGESEIQSATFQKGFVAEKKSISANLLKHFTGDEFIHHSLSGKPNPLQHHIPNLQFFNLNHPFSTKHKT